MTSRSFAILVSQNNKMAVMLVPQTSPLGVELFSYVNSLFCRNNLHRGWPRQWKSSMPKGICKQYLWGENSVPLHNTLTSHSLNKFSYGRVDRAPSEEIERGSRLTPRIFSAWVGGPFRLRPWHWSANEWSENALPLLVDCLPPQGSFIAQPGYFSCPPSISTGF